MIKKLILKKNFIFQTKITKHNSIKLVNRASQRNKHQNRTFFFFNYMINIEDFDSNLLKIDKYRTKVLTFITLDTSQLKKLMIMKIFIALILCI